MKTRDPAVAGTFYPATRDAIEKMIFNILKEESTNINIELASKDIIGAIVPHAGYKYSGYEAVHVFEILHQANRSYDTVIILNPNHHGYGPAVATDEHDNWKTPLGEIMLDQNMIENLAIPKSEIAHQYEHAGEVILPFLQIFLSGDFKIIPISFLKQDPEQAVELAERIAAVNQDLKKKILMIASSDFSHYLPPEEGAEKDKKIIDAILSLDLRKMYSEIISTNASVCGYGPIMTLMHYAKINFAKPVARLLKFGNSGKLSPSDSVVDYASLLFYNN